jgi:hypothetical protein
MQSDPHWGRLKPQKENPSNIADARVWIGGLGRNRTIDTRIFNCSIRQKPSIYAGRKQIACYVLRIVLQPNHRNSLHVFILSARKIVSSTEVFKTAGAVKILLLFSAPAKRNQ